MSSHKMLSDYADTLLRKCPDDLRAPVHVAKLSCTPCIMEPSSEEIKAILGNFLEKSKPREWLEHSEYSSKRFLSCIQSYSDDGKSFIRGILPCSVLSILGKENKKGYIAFKMKNVKFADLEHVRNTGATGLE